MTSAQTRGRLTLVAIALLFALPIAVAMYFYFADNGWRPGENTQYGDLITPPVSLPDVALTREEPTAHLREVWTLMVPVGADCDATCADALDKARQVRRWLGPKIHRLQTLALPATQDALSSALLQENPQLIVAEPQLSADIRAAIGSYNNGQIFLVDPFGNMMMSYRPGTDMGDIRKDLGHLLRISTIG